MNTKGNGFCQERHAIEKSLNVCYTGAYKTIQYSTQNIIEGNFPCNFFSIILYQIDS